MNADLPHANSDDSIARAAAARGRAMMMLSVLFFTANSLLVRLLGDHHAVPSWLVAGSRFLIGIAAVILLARTGYRGGKLSFVALTRNPWLIIRGIVGSLGVYFYYLAINQSGVGRAIFISTTYIPLGAVLAAFFLREPLRPRTVMALLLGIAGVALMTGFSWSNTALAPGDLWAVLTAVSAAIVIVLIRLLHQRETTSTIFAAQCIWGLAIAAAPTVHHWETPTLVASLLLTAAAGCSVCGQLAMTGSFRALPVAEGALIQLLVPFGVALGGVVFFGETYRPAEQWGAGLILMSCIVSIQLRPRLAAGLPAVESHCRRN